MELPPQIVKQQVRSLATSQDGLALRAGGGIQPFGSRLPVLQAFQEFLEIERRKARRRMVALGLIFLGLLIAVATTAAVLLIRFTGRVEAEVHELQRALARAYDEQGAMRVDGEAMRRALADAKESLDALHSRLERESARSPAIDLATFATTLETLRKLQDLQPDFTARVKEVDELEREGNALLALQKAYTERRLAWRAERRAWETRMAEHEAHRREAGIRMAEALAGLEKASAAADFARTSRRRAPSVGAPPPDPGPAWQAMEQLNQSKFNLPPLVMEFERLERQADTLEETRREIASRFTAWREGVLDVAAKIVAWRSAVAAISGASK